MCRIKKLPFFKLVKIYLNCFSIIKAKHCVCEKKLCTYEPPIIQRHALGEEGDACTITLRNYEPSKVPLPSDMERKSLIYTGGDRLLDITLSYTEQSESRMCDLRVGYSVVIVIHF